MLGKEALTRQIHFVWYWHYLCFFTLKIKAVMKVTKPSSNNLALVSAALCALILACGNDAKAYRTPPPLSINLAIDDQHELGQVQPATPEGSHGNVTRRGNGSAWCWAPFADEVLPFGRLLYLEIREAVDYAVFYAIDFLRRKR